MRILTAHAAKGLEWDLVVVAGVQEGVWPDLRLRGSVLGSERLVDVAAGRDTNAATHVSAQVAALLDEERRLFYVAATRARRALLVTAVDPSTTGSGGEEQPSRFLPELAAADPLAVEEPDAEDDEPEEEPGVRPGQLARPLTLPALVAELRKACTDPDRPEPERTAAAAQLARLAGAGVPGADPDEWWGLRDLSDERGLVDEGQPVRVSPSTVERALRCGLRWLLERHGGSDPPSAKQGIGNLVHAAAMLVAEPEPEPGRGGPVLRGRPVRPDRAAGPLARPARARPGHEDGRQAAAVAVRQPARAGRDRARVRHRLTAGERRAAGRSGCAAGSTGSRRTRRAASSWSTSRPGPTPPAPTTRWSCRSWRRTRSRSRRARSRRAPTSGGAEIVAVGTSHAKPAVRVQPPLSDSEDPTWARQLVVRAADAMAASTFQAVVNESCPYCTVRTACPLSGKGRQVTDE